MDREEPHSQDPVLYAEIPGTRVEVTYSVNEATMDVRFLKMETVPPERQTYRRFASTDLVHIWCTSRPATVPNDEKRRVVNEQVRPSFGV